MKVREVIYTIGYGNRKIENFLKLLEANQIEILVDVRSKPFSRFNPAYRRTVFEQHLQDAGIQYLFMGNELGGKPSDPNLYINGILSYETVRNTPLYKAAVKQLISLSKQGSIICTMCSELEQNNCHRKTLLSDDFIREGTAVIHIDAKGNRTNHEAELKLL